MFTGTSIHVKDNMKKRNKKTTPWEGQARGLSTFAIFVCALCRVAVVGLAEGTTRRTENGDKGPRSFTSSWVGTRFASGK